MFNFILSVCVPPWFLQLNHDHPFHDQFVKKPQSTLPRGQLLDLIISCILDQSDWFVGSARNQVLGQEYFDKSATILLGLKKEEVLKMR